MHCGKKKERKTENLGKTRNKEQDERFKFTNGNYYIRCKQNFPLEEICC